MNQSGLDGPTEDDVPMMHVGPPTVADPNQVTTKPRQMPSSGAAPGVPGGTGVSEGSQEPLDFDPDALGGPEQAQRAEGNDTSTAGNEDTANQPMDNPATDTQPKPKQVTAKMVRVGAYDLVGDVWEANPGLSREAVLDLVTDVLSDRLIHEGASIPVVTTPTPGMGGVGLGNFLTPTRKYKMEDHRGNHIYVDNVGRKKIVPPDTDPAKMRADGWNRAVGNPAQMGEEALKAFVREKASDAVRRYQQRRQGPTPGPDLPPPPPPRNPGGTGTQARPSGRPHPGSPAPVLPVVGDPEGNIDRLRGSGPTRPEGSGEPQEPQEPSSTEPDVPHDNDPIPEEGTRQGETPLARRRRVIREMLTGNGGGGTQQRPDEERDDR